MARTAGSRQPKREIILRRWTMWILYQLLMGLTLLLAGPILVLRRGRHYLSTLPGRLGWHPPAGEGQPLWIHAVSVGEVGVAATLAQAFPGELPLLVTTVTPTGQSRARAAFRGRGVVTYLPLELGLTVRRFFSRFSPRALILVEGDLWPLVLRACARHQIPVVVINGRISDASFRRLKRLKRFPRLLAPLFQGVRCFGVQSDQDRGRLMELGIEGERVVTTGNLKYESPEPQRLPNLETQIRHLAGERPILVAGSTMSGEEEQVVEAFRRLGGREQALLILAPRHPERWNAVYAELCESGMSVLRRSALGDSPDAQPSPVDPVPSILLLDTLGELASLYRLGAGAFIGGTLVPTGGHNPLEAARYGVPVAAGPSMENFREMAQHFDQARAWHRVQDAASLAQAWRRWIDHPTQGREMGQRATALVASHRGALDKTLELLTPLLARIDGGPGEREFGH